MVPNRATHHICLKLVRFCGTFSIIELCFLSKILYNCKTKLMMERGSKQKLVKNKSFGSFPMMIISENFTNAPYIRKCQSLQAARENASLFKKIHSRGNS